MSISTGLRIRRKVLEWFWRYLPGEIVGTITALLGASGAYLAYDHSLLAAAVAGSVCEAIGYYATASIREIIHYYRKHHSHPRLKRIALTTGHSLRGMITEFGPAEFIDGLFIRPVLLYHLPTMLGNVVVGWLVGKLVADFFFYGIAAIGYEARKRLYGDYTKSKPIVLEAD